MARSFDPLLTSPLQGEEAGRSVSHKVLILRCREAASKGGLRQSGYAT